MSLDDLTGCELGTKEFWEENYQKEYSNYEDHGDVGHIWFDEDSQIRVFQWLGKQSFVSKNHKIVDLGCGNGMFLIELARLGYQSLFGVDYSESAIRLARTICKSQELNISFHQLDLLNLEDFRELKTFDIVHDKGTYDAISLCPDDSKGKRESYVESVNSILSENGVFIITSCNWTEDELEKCFEKYFLKFSRIPTPTFKFGGKVGNVVSTVVFKKRQCLESQSSLTDMNNS